MTKTTIKQHDITDCGAACLASISTHYNLQLPFDPYDILASVLSVFTIQLYDCYFNKKTNNSSNSTTYNL